jgi:hypothetical protein
MYVDQGCVRYHISRSVKLTYGKLFYSKRSQFVYGREAEIANVSVGRAVSLSFLVQFESREVTRY